MKRILFLVLIGLLASSCFIQAQEKEINVNPIDSSNYVLDPGGIGGDSLIIDFIEQMPQFPGGEKELFKFINKNLKYPITGPDVFGKVMCRFIVNSDGSVSNPEVIRSLDPACDKEAVRVIKLLPKFIPGKQNGVNVSVWYILPITFKLNPDVQKN
ncbi:TonB family protein [Paludibacter propionicigenes WB4]|uniref:TonB family protein n=1 Tax=Paludibacter propionicigenes (strain DSM 17365 / JCM 13257 / WB4) TaxID=694427 RepID=E4T473_PALPW|nr:energy transducer TonB [Paludibacter propionicigenes]ADQ79517.1 TonB family protein [Paludibacter propionicigenes WB4]